MSFLWRSTVKDIRRKLADPAALLIWMGIPALVGTLLSLLGGGGPPTAHVLVADLDGSFVGEVLANGNAFGDFLQTEEVSLEQGHARIEAGEATALLVLPEGFQAAVLAEGRAELELITNPAQTILPMIVVETLEIVLEASFYFQQILGDTLPELTAAPPRDELMVAVNQRIQALQPVLFPPIVTLEVVESESGPPPDFGFLFLPGIIFMALMFTAQGMSDDVWQEKAQGTLRRAVVSQSGLASFLAGKVVAAGVIVGSVTLVGLVFGVVRFGLAAHHVPAALLWCVVTGASMYVFFLAIQLLASNARAGNVLTSVILFPLIMVGGSFFPFETMPEFMAQIGRFTPNGLALLEMKDILDGTSTASGLVAAASALVVPASIVFVWCVGRVRRFATI